MAAYPSYDQIRKARLDARRRDAVRILREAENTARAAGGRLVVFGSLVEGGFNEESDLDIAVFDMPSGLDDGLAVTIDTAVRLAGFSADVIPERVLPPSLRERILRHGKEPSALG
jgi:predicted nucleotidyltransferase